MTYYSGFLLAVPEDRKEDYRKMAEDTWSIFENYGALSMQENWGADVPEGKVTSFGMATKQKEGESIVFSWIEWPDRATCDRAWAAMMQDEQMQMKPEDMPFDGMRMMWGGFEPLVTCTARDAKAVPA